jgi:hypothetical protein
MPPAKDLEEQEVEEVVSIEPPSDDDIQAVFEGSVGKPDWWGPEQDRAWSSHVLCICGHEEHDHMVPKDDEDRECFPSVRWGFDEDEVDRGCACMDFHPAPDQSAQRLR